LTTDWTRLEGRVALVTGASSGLGAHFAKVLAQAGARVALGARRRDQLEAVAAEIGDNALAMELDVTDDASVVAALDRIESAFGTVDLLVNNAGIVEQGRNPLKLPMAQFQAVVDVNLVAVFRVAQAVAARLVAAAQPGTIVNIGSLLGFETSPGIPAYCATKAGVAHLTRQLALDLARHDIRVNALAPGYFKTELNRDFLESEAGLKLVARVPQKRLGRLEELDGPLLLLAGAGGSYVTGAVLSVDGGHLVAGV
jgi:NAD(P)-dependent dehydrogenase (short-subunit alcohol dehydrogenase family)